MRLDQPERRASIRFPTHLEGWIVGKPPHQPVQCTVLDLSDGGARLTVPAPADIPVEFELKIPDHGALASAKLIWASGDNYGVAFTD
ncbi:PilZ domain-containing protein [Microvirga sp. BT688]|uniref:PilZ domain-containing protein n=1 Tax=Microvirga sp. TaxID=1873136 RepID=UPI001688DC8E|nr:PilZ domain-containing protein [Microvirga sp.]MBD2745904.1 PilZ domain-containing protein [Microvirga sp.]